MKAVPETLVTVRNPSFNQIVPEHVGDTTPRLSEVSTVLVPPAMVSVPAEEENDPTFIWLACNVPLETMTSPLLASPMLKRPTELTSAILPPVNQTVPVVEEAPPSVIEPAAVSVPPFIVIVPSELLNLPRIRLVTMTEPAETLKLPLPRLPTTVLTLLTAMEL